MIDIKNGSYKVNKSKVKIEQFKINSSGIFQIVGPNGVGKTRLLEYIYTTCKGSNSIAYLNQKIFLFKNLSILENFELLIPNFEQDECEKLLKLLNINKELNLKVRFLSKGQQRKIQIIIILSQNADYIFLDEPFNHLDKDAKKELLELLKKRSEICAIIIIDHTKSIYTSNVIEHSFLINYSHDENYNPKNKSIKFRLNYKLVKNFSFFTKTFTIVLIIIVFGLTTFIMENNPLYYVNHNKKIDPITAQCINKDVSPAYDYIFDEKNELVNIPLKNRLYFNKFYYNSPVVGEGLVRLEQPKDFFTSYDQPYTSYGYYKMYKGSWPKEYSNEILVNYYLADAIKRVKHMDSIEDVLQMSIDYSEFHFVISGIYIPFESSDVQSSNILEAYNGTSTTGLGMCTYYFPNDNTAQIANNVKVIAKDFIFTILIIIISTSVIFVLERSYIQTLEFYNYLKRLITIQVVMYVIGIIVLFIYYFNTPA